MWNPALPDPAQIQRACAPNCGGQGMAETGSAPLVQTAQTQLVHLGEQLQGLLQTAWLDMLRAVEASRPLAEAGLLWLHHMTPDTTHRLGKTALQWLAVPAVQHVLMGSAVLLLLLYLLLSAPRGGLRPARPPRGSRKLGAALRFLESRKPQPARPTRAAASIASTTRASRPRRASGWQTAAMGVAAGGAAVAATAAFADCLPIRLTLTLGAITTKIWATTPSPAGCTAALPMTTWAQQTPARSPREAASTPPMACP